MQQVSLHQLLNLSAFPSDLVSLPGTSTTQSSSQCYPKPLALSGALQEYQIDQITPIVGSRFRGINLAEILRSPNCDAKIRDLAITISQRGVCVFPKQVDLTIQDQKLLARKLGQLTWRPASSDLHIHPINNQNKLPDGTTDLELTTLERDPTKKLHTSQTGFSGGSSVKKQSHLDGWHTDSSYENTPADYTLLHMKLTPATGGDTLFASAYELYDLLSYPYQKFLEGLTATFTPPGHHASLIAERMYKGHRGSPDNVGPDLRASHPCVRTNPVTGWKYVFALGHHLHSIDGLADMESKRVVEHLERLLTENHHVQVRVKWSTDDLVIWDNRAVYHCATYDYNAKRLGNRICGIGERGYLDPASTGRRDALSM